ncbi:esterase/lipase family protein [Amycolatopsis sp. NPDC052450]|uniref:esterase/lipase family protein n=1 Tax=Amycolatopsis sp. NPDC052450 TaxID=3363937 RepID=UPI0037C9D3D4
MRTRLRLFSTIIVTLTVTALSAASAASADGRSADLPVIFNSVPAVAASLARPGGPPPGANDWSCRSVTHPRPVILLHGTHANMAVNWNTLSPLLKNNGYCVFALNYGGLLAGQIGGTGDIHTATADVAAFVDRVLTTTGASETDLVGHSLGGTVAQYYVKFFDGAKKVHNVIGLAPTSHGSTASGLDNWIKTALQLFPPLKAFITTHDPAALQQLRGSAFLARLNSLPDTVPGVHYTTIVTRFDAVVTPYQSQFLTGDTATNILLQDKCANDYADHLAPAFDHVALQEVLNALDPATARRPHCTTPVWPVIGG